MTKVGIDFTKTHTKRYRSWRIVRTAPRLVDLYRRRIKALDGYKSAIIFPEQLLGLDQKKIYVVTDEKQDDRVTVVIRAVSNFQPEHQKKDITNAHDIFECEADLAQITMSSYRSGSQIFTDLMLFSGKADAIKFAGKRMEKLFNSIA